MLGKPIKAMQNILVKKRCSQGNALFLILIAVALFAALAYAVTQSGRGGSGSVDKERAQIAATNLMNNTAGVRAATNRLSITGAMPMFNTDTFVSNDGTIALPMGTPADPSNYIFDVQGGGAPAMAFDNDSEACPN